MTPKDLKPYKKLKNQDGTVWSVYHENDTGLRLICLENPQSGLVTTTTIANPEKRTSAHRAWAGARHSRAPGYPWEIMHEMGEKGVDPDQKIDEMFSTYGHASVGDMARLEAQFMGVPMHFCMSLFNSTSINSGQEKSTRYQPKFGTVVLHKVSNYLLGFPADEIKIIENMYQEFGTLSLELFAKHRELLTPAFKEFFKIDPENKGQQGALVSRVLDCARFFLLFGQNTGMSLETSARDWSRIISELRASPINFYGEVGLQLTHLFAPTLAEEKKLEFKAEAPSLIRHTEKALTTNENLIKLKNFIQKQTNLLDKLPRTIEFRGRVPQKVYLFNSQFSEIEKLVAEYLLTLWPGLDTKKLLFWIKSQSPKVRKEIGKIIFSNHNNYHELPNFARVTGITLNMESFLGELRDFNRHRAFGRFIPMPLMFGLKWDFDTASQILSKGFGLPLYLTEISELKKYRNTFQSDLENYYQKLFKFINFFRKKYGKNTDYSFVINLLPLAHQMDLWMHGDPKQIVYLTNQRSRPGGHINYRSLAYEANQLVADSDPYFKAIKLPKKPNPSSKDEFFDRS